MSLGLSLGGDAVEVEVVLYAGGLADMTYVLPDSGAVIAEYAELDDADQFGLILDRVIACMTGN